MNSFFKYLILIISILLLFFLERSFVSLSLVFLFVSLLSFFFSGFLPLFSAIFGGLLLDLASFLPFGFFILILVIISLLVQKAELLFQKTSLLSFLCLFAFAFLFFKVCFFLASFLFLKGANISFHLFLEFLYSFIIAFLCFLVLKLKRRGYEG